MQMMEGKSALPVETPPSIISLARADHTLSRQHSLLASLSPEQCLARRD